MGYSIDIILRYVKRKSVVLDSLVPSIRVLSIILNEAHQHVVIVTNVYSKRSAP